MLKLQKNIKKKHLKKKSNVKPKANICFIEEKEYTALSI